LIALRQKCEAAKLMVVVLGHFLGPTADYIRAQLCNGAAYVRGRERAAHGSHGRGAARHIERELAALQATAFGAAGGNHGENHQIGGRQNRRPRRRPMVETLSLSNWRPLFWRVIKLFGFLLKPKTDRQPSSCRGAAARYPLDGRGRLADMTSALEK
jgi:hypothetical protein